MKWNKQRTDKFDKMGSRFYRRLWTIVPAMALGGWMWAVHFLPEQNTDAAVTTQEVLPRAALTDSIGLQLPFVVDSLCRISDPARSLDLFLGSLDRLLEGHDTIVKIVHLGDSHVQAGFYSGQVMRLLHGVFGNAGRGWISPLKLARVNEPKDYRITSFTVKEWIVGRCVQKEPGCPWGLGGIGIRPRAKTLDFAVGISPLRGAGYEFSELHLYRDARTLRLLPGASDARWTEVVCGVDPRVPNLIVDTFRLAATVDSLHLYSVDEDTPDNSGTDGSYYGFSLLNGQPGILYHSIGQNGAMFTNYTSHEYVRQLSLLNPSLLIVSLGTNEAHVVARNFRKEEFIARMDGFIRLVREYLPATAVLLTTPAENFRRTRNGFVRNENIAQVASAITAYAEEQGLACFDLYHATGGVNSCRKWHTEKLLGRDRVHYTVEGYCEQGKLLYKALIRLKMEQQNMASGESV